MLLAINMGIAVSCIGFLLISISNDYFWRADFSAFYTGGALVRDSLGTQLYDLELQTEYQKEILLDRSFKGGVLPFNYPPYVAILFLPFSYVSLKTAYFLWMIIQMIFLVILIFLLIRITASWEANERKYLIATTLSMPYLLTTFLLGSFSLLMLIGILQFYLSFKSNQYHKAGLWLSLLAIKPQIMVVPIIIVVGSKRWKTLLTTIIIGSFLFLSIGVLLGWKTWVDFIERLSISSSYFDQLGIYPDTMHNFKGAMTSILGNNNASFINLVSFIFFILMIFFIFFIWRRGTFLNSPIFDLMFSLSMVLAILFSLHVNPQDTIILIAPLTIFLNFFMQNNYDHRKFILFLLIVPMISWLSDFLIKENLLIRPTILMMVILVIWIFRVYLKQSKTTNQGIQNFYNEIS